MNRRVRLRQRARVVLRDVREDDLPILFAHQEDPRACRMAAFRSRDRESFMAHWGKILADPHLIKKTIELDHEVVGNIVCFEHRGQRLVGYWIGRDHWGRGIATQALAGLLKQVPFRPLFARVAKHNAGSIRVLEKCGFQIEGEEKVSTDAGGVIQEYVFKLPP